MVDVSQEPMKPTDRVSLDKRALEMEQAQLLFDRARSSATSVFALVVLFSFVMGFVIGPFKAGVWFAVASAMIAVTIIQPRLFTPPGITPANATAYLLVHSIISGITGAVWGIGAAWMADPDVLISVYTGVVMVLTITLGGISPQSAFRRSYVALATMTMLPFAGWILFAAPWPVNTNGIGVVIAYAFFMAVSARVEIGTRDLIAAKRNIELTDELRRQRDAVQKANEEKTRFLAATSHDLAQPLHAQGFYLSALREKSKDPEVLALVDKVSASWRSLGQLLEGLVEINRLDAGAVLPHFTAINLPSHIERVILSFEGRAAEKDIELSAEGPDLTVMADAALLSRVIGNLLSNAIKFTPRGGRVAVEWSAGEKSVQLTIHDTGAGIPPAALSSVFDEYVQLGNPERNREKGLGLGLSIVRRLTDLMGITVVLQSAPGEGTKAVLEIPLTTKMAEHASSGETLVPEDRERISSLKVLIVDDEEAIRLSMSEVLTSWGCEVYCTDGMDDVVQFLDRMDVTPDVVIADHRLGGLTDGARVIEKVRGELNDLVPAILMTGDSGLNQSKEEAEVTQLLFKPIDPAALRAALLASSAAASQTD